MNSRVILWPLLFVAIGCEDPSPSTPHATSEETATPPTNRIDIPRPVRSNLGITFVTVERRRVEKTLRVPGRFEFLPTARREYRTMMSGQVTLLVDQFASVEPDQALYRIDSPGWRKLQQELAEAVSAVTRLSTKAKAFEPLQAAHTRHEETLVSSIALWQKRVKELEELKEAGGGRLTELANARASLVTAQANLAEAQEREQEIIAQRAETEADLSASKLRHSFLFDSAASLLGLKRASLEEEVSSAEGPKPRWTTIATIEVRAVSAGVVESFGLTNGAWADEKVAVLTVVQPDQLRFRARGLQSDLGVLRDGLSGRIVPPAPTSGGRSVALDDTMNGVLSIGLSNDPRERTVDLYLTPESLSQWAQPGVAAQLEIITDSTARPELSIPLAAVQRDGIMPILFRRSPDDPDQAIRVDADLGKDDGRWVTVLSGLMDGDEVVLDGGFQLMLATSGTIQKGGHFHADGTYHEGEH